MNTKRTILPTLLFLAICSAIISGCSDGEKSVFHNISPKGWVYGDTLDFDVANTTVKSGDIESQSDSTASDSTKLLTGDIILVVRHSNAYEYSNIWLSLKYYTENAMVNDTINVSLADDFGNWYGKGMGVSYQYCDTVARNVTIDTSTPIKIWHIMRADTLPDIEQIGIIFK